MAETCEWCGDRVIDYYVISEYQSENHLETKYMCYACALISRKLRFA